MSNQSVFNPQDRPVYTQVTNTVRSPGVVAPPQTGAGSSGRQFASSATTATTLGLLGGTVTATIRLTNPGGSGVTAYISRITGGSRIALNLLSTFSSSIQLVSGGSIASPSPLTPFNTRLSSSITSAMTLQSSASAITGGTSFMTTPLDPGLFAFAYAGSLVVPPGQTLSLTVSASLSVAGSLSTTANFEWWEA